jgi:RNA polymerase sigma-70 factor (ECF subfamily)
VTHGGVGNAAGDAGRLSADRPEIPIRAALVDIAPAVRRYLFTMCGDWHEASDLAQEAMLKAWRSRERFDGRADVRTWAFAIARNNYLDHHRKRSRRPKEEAIVADRVSDRPGPAEDASKNEWLDAVGAAVSKLPQAQRDVVALRAGQALTFRQIAEVLGIPVTTAKSRMQYALGKLADELEAFGPE